jgi:hypothetical protein
VPQILTPQPADQHQHPGDSDYLCNSGQGVKPVESLSDLAQPELRDSDEEYEEFVMYLYASRRAGTA